MTIEEIYQLAENFITSIGYSFGGRLGIQEINGKLKVEIAYEGKTDRCQYTDPPSIEILVDPKKRNAELFSLM